MLTPEKYISMVLKPELSDYELGVVKAYHKLLLQSIIDDLEANRNKNAVEYLKSKL